MDERSAEATHDLLLDMAGRVDDDLLAWARELVAVGETQHAFELISATLVADRVALPGPTRAALVDATRTVRTELDADRTLAAPLQADSGTQHRFDSGPLPTLTAAVRALPARLLVGCRVLLARRLTPAGSAPGPLPHPVVLVEVAPGARNRDVLAYQLADALDRAGVRASVEVTFADQQLPGYHIEALHNAQPVRPGGPGGPGDGSALVPPTPDHRPAADLARGAPSSEPTHPPVPLRAAGGVGPTATDLGRGDQRHERAGNGRAPSDQDEPDRVDAGPAWTDRAEGDRAGVVWTTDSPARTGQGEGHRAGAEWTTAGPARNSQVEGHRARAEWTTPGPARNSQVEADRSGPDPLDSGTDRSHGGTDRTALGIGRTDSDPDRTGRTGGEPARISRTDSHAGPDRSDSEPVWTDQPMTDLTEAERTDTGPARSETSHDGPHRTDARTVGADQTAAGHLGADPTDAGPTRPGRPGADPVAPARAGLAGAERAEVAGPGHEHGGPDRRADPAASHPAEPRATELRPGPRPIPADRAPRPTAARMPPTRDPAASVRLVPSDDHDHDPESGPAERRPAEPDRGAQPALAELADRRRSADGAPESDLSERAVDTDLPTRERRHRYLIERPDQDTATGSTGPAEVGPVRAETGNTEPLAIRRPVDRPPPDRPRQDSGSGSGGLPIRRATTSGPREPSTQLPGPSAAGGAGSGELGLRPESVARLSASGRELLARLQAELQGGAQLGPRAGGLSANGGGNGTGPQAKVDPPDLAG